MKLWSRRHRIENLDSYLAAKQYDRALAAVAAELERRPDQFNLLLRQAEILGLAGNRRRAVDVYRGLARRYARDGFYGKAIALYKKIVSLDPGEEEAHAELARLIEENRRSQRPLEERLGKVDVRRGSDRKEREASTLFTMFEREALEEVLGSTSLRTYGSGEAIVTEGDPGCSLFLIVSGQVLVTTRGEGRDQLQLAELGPGDFFGEVSLLSGRPRTATITAATEVHAIELAREQVDRISERFPDVRSVLQSFCERRAHDTMEVVVRRMRGEGNSSPDEPLSEGEARPRGEGDDGDSSDSDLR